MEPSGAGSSRPASRLALVLAFLSVYLIWGSTYLAIRLGVETIPPFTMAGARFGIAGALLHGWARLRGAAAPSPRHWMEAAVSGTLMLLGGNGIVTWAEQWVPSGLAALIISSVPIWMGLFHWMVEPSSRPRRWGMLGLFLGLSGVAILVRPGAGLAPDRHLLIGSFSLIAASAFWALGSLYSRRAQAPSNAALAISLQMLMGSAALLITAVATGEPARFRLSDVSLQSSLSFVYLVLFGSIVGFTSYIWLLRVTTPAKAVTYAYVNPIVAVLLGTTVAGEPIGLRTVFAAVVIIGSVILITGERTRTRPRVPSAR